MFVVPMSSKMSATCHCDVSSPASHTPARQGTRSNGQDRRRKPRCTARRDQHPGDEWEHAPWQTRAGSRRTRIEACAAATGSDTAALATLAEGAAWSAMAGRSIAAARPRDCASGSEAPDGANACAAGAHTAASMATRARVRPPRMAGGFLDALQEENLSRGSKGIVKRALDPSVEP